MAVLQMLGEEEIADDRVQEYFQDLYRIVCVGEKPSSLDRPGGLVRTTYVVDWEQLVHLLESYTVFGEDIVEVAPISSDEARMLRFTRDWAREPARA
jgi:hypothetical protein